jgi:Zn-dependent peptidase ImmA (M78 family)
MKELRDYLLSIARQNGIKVTNVATSSEGPDMAFPFASLIMMNPNSDSKYSYEFRLAHEISHILYGDSDAEAVYHFSPFALRTEERSANRHAIRLIARYMYEDTPVENRNWIEFMDEFGLQSHFEMMVKDVIYN